MGALDAAKIWVYRADDKSILRCGVRDCREKVRERDVPIFKRRLRVGQGAGVTRSRAHHRRFEADERARQKWSARRIDLDWDLVSWRDEGRKERVFLAFRHEMKWSVRFRITDPDMDSDRNRFLLPFPHVESRSFLRLSLTRVIRSKPQSNCLKRWSFFRSGESTLSTPT